jgi:hypothetical protein
MKARKTEPEPIILRWHAGAAASALFYGDLNCHSGRELLNWVARGVDVVVVDHATGEDITRLFLAHWQDGRAVDPIGAKQNERPSPGPRSRRSRR